MGRGGISTWNVQLLKFGPGKAKICRAILGSRCKDPEAVDLDAWHEAMISALKMLADNSVHVYMDSSRHDGVGVPDVVFCELFEICDDFELEEELGSDGFYSYVHVIDPEKTASELLNFLNSPDKSFDEISPEQRVFMDEQWSPKIKELLHFLKSDLGAQDQPLFVQIVYGD